MRYLVYSLGALLTVGLLATLASCVTQIGPGELGVVRRFGRVLDDRPGPGLHIGLPWGIDRVDRVDVATERTLTVGFVARAEETGTPRGQLLTGDHNLVNVQAALNYKVNEEEVVDYLIHADRVRDLLEWAAETALAEWVAGRKVDEVLLRGKELLPAWLVAQTQQRVRPYRLGVTVLNAGVTHLAPPAEVKQAFEDVTRAESDIETKTKDAKQKAERREYEALAMKYEIERLTEAHRHEQGVMAEADAYSFERRLDQYRKLRADNPHYLRALWWDEMGRLYARMRETGRIDLLDNRLGADGLDLTQFPLVPRKK